MLWLIPRFTTDYIALDEYDQPICSMDYWPHEFEPPFIVKVKCFTWFNINFPTSPGVVVTLDDYLSDRL